MKRKVRRVRRAGGFFQCPIDRATFKTKRALLSHIADESGKGGLTEAGHHELVSRWEKSRNKQFFRRLKA